MNWIITVGAQAEKQLRKFPPKDYERIRLVINTMEIDPFFGDVNKLSEVENVWRRKMGNYRMLYEIDKSRKLIYISDIKRRASNTY